MDSEQTYLRTIRGRSQFDIVICHEEIRGTQFAADYLPLVDRFITVCREHDSQRIREASGAASQYIFDHFSSTLERLSPQAECFGYTLSDLVYSPTYSLGLKASEDGEDVETKGTETSTFRPAFSMCPINLEELPAYEVQRVSVADVKVNVDRKTSAEFGSPQGRVMLLDGRTMFLKVREEAREEHFDRELKMLALIRQLGLIDDSTKLPSIEAIVTVDRGVGEECVGVLLSLIPAAISDIANSLLGSHFWQQPKQHRRWEAQVRRIVEVLHAHDLVWGDVNPGNVVIDNDSNAWVIDFGGGNNPEFVDDDKTNTIEGDWQGVDRLFGEWLPSRVGSHLL